MFYYRKDSGDPRQITRSVVEIKVKVIHNRRPLNIISGYYKISCGMDKQDIQCIGKYQDKDKDLNDTFSIKGDVATEMHIYTSSYIL